MADPLTSRIDLTEIVATCDALGRPDFVDQTILRALREIMVRCAGEVTERRMTHANPPYLNRRTGSAITSVLASPHAEGDGGTFRGWFGSNLNYVRAHERGLDKMVAVRAHIRRRLGRPKSMKISTRRVDRRFARTAASKALGDVIYVRGHARHMKFPARHFLLHTLQANILLANNLLEFALGRLAATRRPPSLGELRSF